MRYVLSVSVASITWCSFKGAAKKGLGVAAVVALAFLPSSQADADIVVNATGIVTESTQVVPGTPFDFTATVNENAQDALPDLDALGIFNNDPLIDFSLQLGTGVNAVTVEGGLGGNIAIGATTGTGGISVSIDDIDDVEGLPDGFNFGNFSFNFENVNFQSASLLDGLVAFDNQNVGVFNANISPTTAIGTVESFSVTVTSVPEPTNLALLAIVALGAATRRRRNDNGYDLVA